MLMNVPSVLTHSTAPPLLRCGLLALAAALAACSGGDPPPEQRESSSQSPSEPSSGTPAGAGPAGAVSGRLSFVGARPAAEKVAVTKDQEVCGAHPIVKEDLLVAPDGGLKNVVISIQGVPGADANGLPASELRQEGCAFKPHVTIAAVGRALPIFNDDGILHNIHTFSTLNRPLNKAQPKFLKRIEVQFGQPETIRVTCDAHPWMSSWIVVSDHPYVAVSDESGSFRIDGVPAGTYTVHLWHETLGERTQQVDVRPDQTAEVSVEFSRSS